MSDNKKGKVDLLASDPRLGKMSGAIVQDREIQKSLWLDVVPRATLHYIACVDPPTYTCPMGLGLSTSAESAVEKTLKVQEELDEKRGAYAEKLRSIRSEFLVKREDFLKKRSAVVVPMAGEGLPFFWVTVLRNTPQIWESFTDRDELALKYIANITWCYVDKRAGLCEPEDCDFLKEHQRRSFKIEMTFKENPFIKDEKVWVEFKYNGQHITAKSSGIAWKPDKCFTVRKRDMAPTAGAQPVRYRTSFFLLFEATSSAKEARGLWDAHEKLALARTLKDEVVPKAVEILQLDPSNTGADDVDDVEDEDKLAEDDIGSDTSEEEEEEAEEESDSDDDEPKTLQEKAEAAAKKRKGKSGGDGMLKKALGTRDPCVMFVLFIMAANLLIVPISWIIDM